jgi:hypothetical protein
MMDTISSAGTSVGHGSIGLRERDGGPKAAPHRRLARCTDPSATARSGCAGAAEATLAAEADILQLLAIAP